MTFKLPSQNKWNVSTASDLFGDIVRSRNIDLSEMGKVRLARKACAIFTDNGAVSTTGDADFDKPFAIVGNKESGAGTTNYIYVFTSGSSDRHFRFTISETAVNTTQITATGAPTIADTSDAISFEGEMVVSGTDHLRRLADTGTPAWSSTDITDFSLTSGVPHPLCRFENRRTFIVGNGSSVQQSDVAAFTEDESNLLTLPDEFIVTSMRWRGNRAGIGTRNIGGGNAMFFLWSGSGTSAESGWPVDADWIYSVCEYGNSWAVLTSAGQLLRFNGGGFDVLANFPVYYTPYSWTEAGAGANTLGKAINRSMFAVGDTIYITIQGEPTGIGAPDVYKQPGGLWIFDPEVGLYHRAGFVTEPYRVLAISSLASSEFTFASAHNLSNGDPVYAFSVSNIAALVAGKVYYAIVVSSTSIKLAFSPIDAEEGRFITCSGVISGDSLAAETLDALGNVWSVEPGAVYGFGASQPTRMLGTEILFCGASEDPVGSEIHSMMSLGSGRNVGNFITPRIYAENAMDTFRKIISNIEGLNLDTDKVVIKYRTKERPGVPTPQAVATSGYATWVDTTNFDVDTTAKDVKSAQVGDEVEIMMGAGAGYSAHITAINDATSTYRYTVDETIPEIAASDKSDVQIDNWTKLAVITKDNTTYDQGFIDTALGKSNGWIQFKVELRGRDVAVNMLRIANGEHKPI